jgi:predicted Zn-ribbon and HTH transcriptional regulator
MSKSRWQEYKEKNGATPLDLLNPMTKYANQDLSTVRLSICQECPELIKLTTQCKQCGCFMTLKTKIEAAKCPIGKW